MFTFELHKSNNSFHSKANIRVSKNNGSLHTFNEKKKESVQSMYTKIDEFQIIKLTKNKTKKTFKCSLVYLLQHGANNARVMGLIPRKHTEGRSTC